MANTINFVFIMTKPAQHHFKIYKPFGMLSQLASNSKEQLKNKRFLSELYAFPPAVMPIGRLDEKSEGLLLLTTNGLLSDTINRSGIEKEYWVQLDGIITSKAIRKLAKGVEIGFEGKKYISKSCKVIKISPPSVPLADSSLRIGRHRPASWINITLREGKNRQVRKMTAAVGFPTLRLLRIRIGNIKLDSLRPGEVVPCTDLLNRS